MGGLAPQANICKPRSSEVTCGRSSHGSFAHIRCLFARAYEVPAVEARPQSQICTKPAATYIRADEDVLAMLYRSLPIAVCDRSRCLFVSRRKRHLRPQVSSLSVRIGVRAWHLKAPQIRCVRDDAMTAILLTSATELLAEAATLQVDVLFGQRGRVGRRARRATGPFPA